MLDLTVIGSMKIRWSSLNLLDVTDRFNEDRSQLIFPRPFSDGFN